MTSFIHDDFLLQTEQARRLYHGYANGLPIIDYHCHLSPELIASNHAFGDITEVWLAGDHYKWRAMRANGIDERYITGDASPREKFQKWAETVPYTLRNPLYHWTHMELKAYFGVDELLSGKNADAIFDHCNALLATEAMRVQSLLSRMKVEVVCTTDDPVDTLEFHHLHSAIDNRTALYPTFRPDALFNCSDIPSFLTYIQKLAESADVDIDNFESLKKALLQRLDFFHKSGCRLSDHGFQHIFSGRYDERDASKAFLEMIAGQSPSQEGIGNYQTALLFWLCNEYARRGWTQQFHLGALRNNNTRKLRELGPDTGYDSIGDFGQAEPLRELLNRLEEANALTKTILYNLNPSDKELFATMAGNFNDGSLPGKVQYGASWWFLDQKDGIEKQLNALSNMGLVSRFVGMLTDSRSFLSFPRHDYFRRVLCNLFGQDIEQGLIPSDIDLVGQMVQDISYYNAKNYFQFQHIKSIESHES